jgi:hypothetical protein
MRLRNAASRSDAHIHSARDARVTTEFIKLKSSFASIVGADHRLSCLGPDALVDQIISSLGIDRRQAFTGRMLLLRHLGSATIYRTFTAIVVASRLLHSDDTRALIREAVAMAERERTKCMIVPQKWICAPRRHSTARLIACSATVETNATQRLGIITHVIENGWSTLGECALMTPDHDDPVGAVLCLVAAGDLTIDRSRPIGPHSRIDLAQRQ